MSAALLADYAFDFKVAQGVGALAQRLVYSDDELLISLSNSLKLREQEIADSNSFTGRLMGLFTTKDTGDGIQVDGMRLKQLHDLTGSKPRKEINLNGLYDVNLAYFQMLLGNAREAAAAKTDRYPDPSAPQ